MSKKNTGKILDKLPFELEDVDAETRKKIVTLLKDDKCVFVGPKRYLFQYTYRENALELYNFKARPDDVWLLGFPRSGTTLHCEMVWLIGNDLNFEKASEGVLSNRFPHFDFALYLRREEIKDASEKTDISETTKNSLKKRLKVTFDYLNNLEGRRFLKSHIPISLMPPSVFESGAKIIYCARNPKDVVVSLYHAFSFFNAKIKEEHSFKNFVHSFIEDLVMLAPFFEHIKEAWAKRHDDKFLFLFYEDCLKDKRQTIAKVSKFLDKNLTEDQITGLEDHLGFDKFKKNTSVNFADMRETSFADKDSQFIRRGKAGGWRDYFDDELSKEFDNWVEKNLRDTDLKFPEC